MQAAAKLDIQITINQVGNDMPSTGTPGTAPTMDKTKDWQPGLALDEDGLHQLRASLVQSIEAPTCMVIHIVPLNALILLPEFNHIYSDKFNPVYICIQPSCLYLICNSLHSRIP